MTHYIFRTNLVTTDIICGDFLEDALVLLSNANFRLNAWRPKRFSKFFTEAGKHTLKESIPADKHLFADKFHAKIRSEHDHSSINSAPPAKCQFKQPYRRDQSFHADQRSTDNDRLEANGNGDLAQILTTNPPKRAKTDISSFQLPGNKASSR